LGARALAAFVGPYAAERFDRARDAMSYEPAALSVHE